MNKEIKDIAMWEETDSELAKYTIGKLQEENEKLKEKVYNVMTLTVCGDLKQIKNTAQYKLDIAQERIDKAIEYCGNTTRLNAKKVIEILRGEENE